MNQKLRQTRPALAHTLDEVKSAVDLSSFRQCFAGNDQELGEEFDNEASHLIKLVFEESSLRYRSAVHWAVSIRSPLSVLECRPVSSDTDLIAAEIRPFRSF